VHIGHAFYHVVLDVYYRFLSKFTDNSVIFPAYSLNFYGKKGDFLIDASLGETETKEKIDSHAKNYIARNRLRDELNLGSSDLLTDNSPQSIDSATRTFIGLKERGFLVQETGKWFLDVPKIAREYNLVSALDSVSFYPERTRSELERLLLNQVNNPVEITRDTAYSVKNPIGGKNLGPLFVLATLWEGNYGDADYTFATSESAFTKYVLFRMLIRLAIIGNPGMKEVLVYNKIEPKEGFEEWSVPKLTTNPYEADMLRYSLISSHSLNKQIVNLDKRVLQGGRNFVYLVGNLRKFFRDMEGVSDGEVDGDYLTEMKAFKFNKVLSRLEGEARLLSRKINSSRDNGELNKAKQNLFLEYLELANKLSPMLPAITSQRLGEI